MSKACGASETVGVGCGSRGQLPDFDSACTSSMVAGSQTQSFLTMKLMAFRLRQANAGHDARSDRAPPSMPPRSLVAYWSSLYHRHRDHVVPAECARRVLRVACCVSRVRESGCERTPVEVNNGTDLEHQIARGQHEHAYQRHDKGRHLPRTPQHTLRASAPRVSALRVMPTRRQSVAGWPPTFSPLSLPPNV